jgi:heat shock protein beta
MKGVVDSDDLPLNVNRETLQESKIIQVIRKKVVRKALEMIKKFIVDSETEETVELDEDGEVVDKTAETKKRQDKYNDWVKKFSPSLKAGAIEDEPNRAKIMKCLRFSSTKTGKDGFTSLETYVENMKEWQKEIYFVAGMQQEGIEKSQFLEPFHQKDIEVLYFTDPMDEYLTQNVKLFDSKKFINIASESVKFKDEDEDLEKRKEKFYKEKYKPLTKWLKKLYGASIMRVVISKRLVSAPAIASSAEFGHSANMERILRAQAYSHGQHDFGMRSMKIFEINPRHPLIVKLLEGTPSDEEGAEEVVDADTENAAWLLHEMALLNGGFPLTDPEAHTQRMMKFMSSSLGVESMELEAEPDLPVEEEEAPDFSEFDLDAFAEEYEKEERDAIPLKADADADEDDDEYEAPTIGKNGGMDDMDAFASMYAKNQKAHGPKGTGPEDAIPLKADADGNIDLSEL